MVCPNCGANLENIDSELKQCYCQYCGTKIAIDDGTKVTKNYNYDEADIIRAQTEQQIRLQEMKQQEEDLKQLKKNKKMYYKILICVIAVSLVVDFLVWIFAGNDTAGTGLALILLIAIIGFEAPNLSDKEKEIRDRAKEVEAIRNGYIKFPSRVFPCNEQQYFEVENAIRAAGFVNVTSINMHDLTLGILQKPSLVESISVNGDKINSGGEMYPINTPIVITYHGK